MTYPRLRTSLCSAIAIAALGLAARVFAVELSNGTGLTVELRDGSVLRGIVASTNLDFESEVLGKLSLPWVRVKELRRAGEPPRLTVVTRTGDRSTGELATPELRLKTSFGEVLLPRAELLLVRPHRLADPSGLQHYWAGEDSARDSVGEANGTTQAAVLFVPGRKGRAFAFTGTGEGVRFDAGAARLGAEDFTLAFWFRAPRPESFLYVMSKRAACQPVAAWEVRAEPGGEICFVFTGYPAEYKALHVNSRSIVTDNLWHHIVITRSGRMASIHVDGKVDVVEDVGFIFDVGNTAPLRLGSGVCAGQGGATHFTGQLDEVRVFNRALKPGEIEALYRADMQP